MVGVFHPALGAFVTELREELVLAQVLIRRSEPGYELRHSESASWWTDSERFHCHSAPWLSPPLGASVR
jgi:hypothetical protein